MPEKVFHHCCGQFAATREAIRGRSQSFYQDALLYLRPSNNDLTGHHRANRQYVMGVCLQHLIDQPSLAFLTVLRVVFFMPNLPHDVLKRLNQGICVTGHVFGFLGNDDGQISTL